MVEIRYAGNIHYTRTHIHIGETNVIDLHKAELDKQAKQVGENISKLWMIEDKLEEMNGERGCWGQGEGTPDEAERHKGSALTRASPIREERMLLLEHGVINGSGNDCSRSFAILIYTSRLASILNR